MKIILVGYMGSGKSTIGKLISENVGIPFYDLDEYIEEKENLDVKSIFKNKGEIYFRKKENQYLHEFITNHENYVLALGGGTPCYANNHEVLLLKNIQSFYLKASVEELTHRLAKDKFKRPLIANMDNEELEDYIRKHLFDRGYYYLQSKQIVSVDGKEAQEIVHDIVSKLT